MLPACLAGTFPTLQVGIFLHHIGAVSYTHLRLQIKNTPVPIRKPQITMPVSYTHLLKSAERVVEKYGGSLVCEYGDDVFTVLVSFLGGFPELP